MPPDHGGDPQFSTDREDRARALRGLAHAASPGAQAGWRRAFAEPLSLGEVVQLYLTNPFLRLTRSERGQLEALSGSDPLVRLILAREAAVRTQAPRVAVFCMPKSGSSFIQSALQTALDLPFVSLAFFGTQRHGSYFGANSQEQELDELAILRAVLAHPEGFVAQQHTRASIYMALRLQAYGIRPIVTVRSIPDAIVSFDDMIMETPRGPLAHPWVQDAPFLIPSDYNDRPAADRYAILAESLAPWLVNFAVSWRRCEAAGVVKPLRLVYEQDILDSERLVGRLREGLRLTPDQTDRLAAYVRDPDPARSRLNKAVAGRGRPLLPATVILKVERYVDAFRAELADGEAAHLMA